MTRSTALRANAQLGFSSSDPRDLNRFQTIFDEYADEIGAIADRITDRVTADIDRSFAGAEPWREVAFLAICGKVIARLHEGLNELTLLRMSEYPIFDHSDRRRSRTMNGPSDRTQSNEPDLALRSTDRKKDRQVLRYRNELDRCRIPGNAK